MIAMIMLVFSLSVSLGAITQQQGDDVAEFAKKFFEEGNARKDENGFPLLTYCLSGNWKTCIEIRSKGYTGQMYHVKNNGYYIKNGRYLDLGEKWCMDCGTTVLFLLKTTLGFEVWNSQGEPWHVQDVYNDALKGKNSQYFEMIYSGVSVGRIDYSKLQKGDFIAYITSHGNHGMLYLGDGYIAHANRDMIKSYGDNKVSGFCVNKLNQYFLPGTVVRVMRLKDGVIPEDRVVNGVITWPDTGETVDLLGRTPVIELVEEPETSGDLVENIEIVEEEKAVIPDSEKLNDVAKEYVDKKLSTQGFMNQLLFASRPLFYGPYMKVDLVKLQNDSIKRRS